MSSFLCDIVTPESLIFSEEVYFISIPGIEGEFGVLDKRSPIVSALDNGEIRVRFKEGDDPIRFAVSGGYAEFDGSKIIVLASRAVEVSKVTPDEVRETKAVNEKALATLAEDDPRAAFHRDELAWCTLLEKLLSKA
jgi:F-type H+-transporting ATPase subunit epsilon